MGDLISDDDHGIGAKEPKIISTGSGHILRAADRRPCPQGVVVGGRRWPTNVELGIKG